MVLVHKATNETVDVVERTDLSKLESLVKSNSNNIDRIMVTLEDMAKRLEELESPEVIDFDNLTRMYKPHYVGTWKQELVDEWVKLIQLMKTYTGNYSVVAFNPNNGAGSSKNTKMAEFVTQLSTTDVEEILGYVASFYARATDNPPVASPFTGIVYTATVIKENMRRYKEWYPETTGIMIDEVSNDPKKFAFYEDLVNYARSIGLDYVRGNCGTKPYEPLINLFDNVSVSEGKGLIDEATLKEYTYYPKYPKEKFTIVRYGFDTLPVDFVNMAKKYVGLMYIAHNNQYSDAPTYLEDFIKLLMVE